MDMVPLTLDVARPLTVSMCQAWKCQRCPGGVDTNPLAFGSVSIESCCGMTPSSTDGTSDWNRPGEPPMHRAPTWPLTLGSPFPKPFQHGGLGRILPVQGLD